MTATLVAGLLSGCGNTESESNKKLGIDTTVTNPADNGSGENTSGDSTSNTTSRKSTQRKSATYYYNDIVSDYIEYDQDGNVVAESDSSAEEYTILYYHYTFDTDEDGNTIKTTTIDGNDSYYSTEITNPAGVIIYQHTSYKLDGDLVSFENVYDEHGHCTYYLQTYGDWEYGFSITDSYYDANGMEVMTKDDGSTITYEMDENGNTIYEFDQYEDGSSNQFHYVIINGESYTAQSKSYDAEGVLTDYFTTEYDENGNVLSCTQGSEEEGWAYREENVYTWENGLQTGEVCYYLNEDTGTMELAYTTKYEYDSYGNVTYELHTDGNGDFSYDESHSYTYDENGNVITETVIDSYEDGYTGTYTYDENGNLITEVLEYPDCTYKVETTWW